MRSGHSSGFPRTRSQGYVRPFRGFQHALAPTWGCEAMQGRGVFISRGFPALGGHGDVTPSEGYTQVKAGGAWAAGWST
jgi:hypothetical protein